jgi:hypothetical protein
MRLREQTASETRFQRLLPEKWLTPRPSTVLFLPNSPRVSASWRFIWGVARHLSTTGVSPDWGANLLFQLPCFVPQVTGFQRAPVRIKDLTKAIYPPPSLRDGGRLSTTAASPEFRFFRVAGLGFWFSIFKFQSSVFGLWFSVFGFRASDFGFRVSGNGFRVSGLVFSNFLDSIFGFLAICSGTPRLSTLSGDTFNLYDFGTVDGFPALIELISGLIKLRQITMHQ